MISMLRLVFSRATPIWSIGAVYAHNSPALHLSTVDSLACGGGIWCGFVGLCARSEDPFSRFEHKIGERLTLTDRGHSLKLDQLLLALELNLFGATDLSVVLSLEFFDAVFEF